VNEVRIPIPGVLVGHHTDAEARTGCTVLVFPEGSIASGEVRGGAPATREVALLDPTKTVARIDAVVLAGGSAFGLAACDGVVQWCAAGGRGFPMSGGPVPIVVGLALYDLTQGDPSVRPTAHDGERAAERARPVADGVPTGLVGAATGATVGKWRGADSVRPGGLGVAVMQRDDLYVAALVAVNAVGDIDDGSAAAQIAAGTFAWPTPPERFGDPAGAPANTTIGVVLTNAVLDKTACRLVAESGHDGLARALFPAHARSDGDALVAVSVPQLVLDEAAGVSVDTVRILATLAVEHAVRSVA
jgi:L-aminopeptidase/D-esterase-like protein